MENWEQIVEKTIDEVKNIYPQIFIHVMFGAFYLPEQYFVSYVFKTDKELEDAISSGLTYKIEETHKDILERNGYPKEGIKNCVFASQEDCDREFKGNWYYYYK